VRWLLLCGLSWTSLAGCLEPGGEPEAVPVPLDDPCDARPGDGAIALAVERCWTMIGDDLTAGDDALPISIVPPPGTAALEAFVDGVGVGALHEEDGSLALVLDLRDVAPGVHEITVASPGDQEPFARARFVRTHPLYIVVSTDWDDPDAQDASLARHGVLHARHPALILTHLVGPVTFADPSVAPERAADLAAFLRGMRDDRGDEIGLHLHPWCTFVETTGVPCRTWPSVIDGSEDPSGYSVVLASYPDADAERLLAAAVDVLDEAGLGRPVSFRAGAWTAGPGTLRALAAAGLQVDSSAVNWRLLEEWAGLGPDAWGAAHWPTTDDRSQPYRPAEVEAGTLLEVPDNGALVDYVTAAEMIDILDANGARSSLDEPHAVSLGWHAATLSAPEMDRIDEALTHADAYLHAADSGPVVYARLGDLRAVW
jgi:hypothetical protein